MECLLKPKIKEPYILPKLIKVSLICNFYYEFMRFYVISFHSVSVISSYSVICNLSMIRNIDKKFKLFCLIIFFPPPPPQNIETNLQEDK